MFDRNNAMELRSYLPAFAARKDQRKAGQKKGRAYAAPGQLMSDEQ